MIYDFLKLMDRKNPFQLAISLNIIFRKCNLARKAGIVNLENYMNNALEEAAHRLKKELCDKNRKILFIITEIAKDNTRRHWTCSKINGKFQKTKI